MIAVSSLLALAAIGQGIRNPPRMAAQPNLQVPEAILALKGRPIKRMSAQYRAVKPYAVASSKAVLAAAIMPDVDLRPRINSFSFAVRSQGGRGTCSVHAVTFLIEYMDRTRRNIQQRDMSEEYLNHMTNVTIGAYADGDFFSNLALGYAKYGLVPEALLPYQPTYNPNQVVPSSTQKAGWAIFRFSPCFIKEWNVNTGVSPGQLSLATECLKADIPVAAGLRWPTNGNFLTTKVVSMDVMIPPAPSKVVDGHSIALVGYKKSNLFPGGGYFIFRNSWGSGWWDSGYGYLSFAYVAQYANDLFVLVP